MEANMQDIIDEDNDNDNEAEAAADELLRSLTEPSENDEVDLLDAIFAEARASVARGGTHQECDYSVPVGYVALFWRTHCRQCGSVEETFEGLFEERRKLRASTKRLVRLNAVPPIGGPFPRTREYIDQNAHYCAKCAQLDTYQGE